MMLFLTIPTRGDRPELLRQLLRDSGLPPEQILLVRTAPEVHLSTGARVVDDFGPINIQRWWQTGIEKALQLGASSVAVLNDDVGIAPGSLQDMHAILNETGATIATPGKSLRLHRRSLAPQRILVGAFWMVNPCHGLRPCEDFRWFYGDDDLDIRARVKYAGVVTVPVQFTHSRAGQSTKKSPQLQELIQRDRKLFARRHPARYIYRKLWERTDGRVGKAAKSLLKR